MAGCLFGSKDGLVDALAHKAFQLLQAGLDEQPQTDDPAAELRGGTLRILPEGDEERAWRDGLLTVVRGLRATASSRGA
jgi:hypothetical protein